MYEMNDETREYLIEELKHQRELWLMGKENRYSYIFMICNDLGITAEK